MAHILTIAGSDPSGQAGIQADLQVIRDLGHRVHITESWGGTVLKVQLRAILSEYSVDAVKIGLLATNELAYQVYRILEEAKAPHIVVDPIMRSSSGVVMLEDAAIPVLTGFIFPLADLVTPNLDEAETLTNLTVRNPEQMEEAARKILSMSPGLKAVLIKGGHLEGEKVDVLVEGDQVTSHPAAGSLTGNTRGTGCILSTAIACYRDKGLETLEAVEAAKSYLAEFIPRRLE